jgi:hypothetical protein
MKSITFVATLFVLVFVLTSAKIAYPPGGHQEGNLYDKDQGSSKNQKDWAGYNQYALYSDDLNQDEKHSSKKNKNDLYNDNVNSNEDYNDNSKYNRNKKANEVDDYDQDLNALKFNKKNANEKNQRKKTSYSEDSFTQNGAPTVTDSRTNQRYLKKRNSDHNEKKSQASHGEVDNRVNNDSGYGKGAPMHYSGKKHQQKHTFGNAKQNAWNDETNKKDFDETKKITLNINQRKRNFDNLDQDQFRNDDRIAYQNHNQNAKQRRSKDLAEDEDQNRNKYANKKLEKNQVRKQDVYADQNANRNKYLSQKNEKEHSNNADHQYDTADFRKKKITNDEKNGGY